MKQKNSKNIKVLFFSLKSPLFNKDFCLCYRYQEGKEDPWHKEYYFLTNIDINISVTLLWIYNSSDNFG